MLTDPASRIDELLSHHTECLEVMLAAMRDSPETAYTISRYAFLKYDDPFSHGMMLGETLAHLELLESCHQVERAYEDGHILFRQADAVLALN